MFITIKHLNQADYKTSQQIIYDNKKLKSLVLESFGGR